MDPGDEEYDVELSRSGRMLVFDGLGQGLLVWVQQHYGFGEARQELRATRIDRFGNLLDTAEDALLLDTISLVPFDAAPTAVGLPWGGFVVGWAANRSSMFRVLFRLVGSDGVLAPEIQVDPEGTYGQGRPRLAALTDSFVAVWEDEATGEDVWARRFRPNGSALSTPIAVASSTAGRQLAPTVAAQGDAWIVAFLSQPSRLPSSPLRLRARRFVNGGPAGVEFGILDENAMSAEVVAMGEDYLIVYGSRELENSGDLFARTIPLVAGQPLGDVVPLDTTPGVATVAPQVAPYGRREDGGYAVVYRDNATLPGPHIVFVGVTPPMELASLQLEMLGVGYSTIAAAPYELTGGALWLGYSRSVSGPRDAGVLFQLPPP